MLLVLCLACLCGSLAAQVPAPAGGAVIRLVEETHDFGEIVEGGDASWAFRFTNEGTADLLVYHSKASCCLSPDNWIDPVPVGAEGEFRIRYDTHRVGSFDKSVTVMSNATNSPTILRIKGTILPKPPLPTPLAPTGETPPDR